MAKGQGISINVIIIAAIALLVLVVLSVMFLGGMLKFGETQASCEEKGGTCAVDVCPAGMIAYSAWTCPQEAGADQICCISGA